MKLHLNKSLLAAVMACFATFAATTAAETDGVISVNLGTTAVPTTATGELNGVDASGWTNITGNIAAEVNGTHTVGSAVVTINASQSPWGPNNAATGTLLQAIHASYLDLGGANQWTVTVDSDYLVSSVILYMAGDGSKFAPVNVNGTNYVGGTNATGDSEWGNRSTKDSDVSDDTNTITVTGLVGGHIVSSNKVINQTNRGTIGGFQVIDTTADYLYTTALGDTAVSAGEAGWTKGGETVSIDDIETDARYMGTTGTGTIAFEDSTTLTALQAADGTATVTGANLTIGTLFAKSGATLNLAGSLAESSSVATGGMGTVKFSADQTIGTLTQGGNITIAEGKTLTAETWNHNYGTMTAEAGAALKMTGDYGIFVAKEMIDSFSGDGTLHFTSTQTGWQPNGSAITLEIADKKVAFDNGLVLNGWGQDNQKINILTGGEMTVSAAKLEVRRMFLTVDGGKLTAEEGIAIGHPETGNYKGGVTLSAGEIVTSVIEGANKQAGNAFNMTGGKLTATGSSVFSLADNSWYGRDACTEPRLEVTVSGGTIATTADGATLAGSASESLSLSIGGVTFDVQGSSLDINHAYTQTGTITHSGSGTLTITGNVSLSGIEVLQVASDSVRSYSDGDNGYVGGTFALVSNEAGSGATSITGTVTIGEEAQTVITNDNGIFLTVVGTQGVYHVNSGSVTYADGENIASDKTTGIALTNGTLVLNKALADGVSITAGSGEGTRTISIAEDVALAGSSVTAEGTTRISGAGSFNIGASVTLPTNISLDTDWKGTVVVDGFVFGSADNGKGSAKLNALANANSAVGLTGCTGWLEPGGTISSNLKLLDGNAITLTDGSSDRTQTFSGSVSGTGDFVIGMSGKNVGGITYDFSGDVSEWTGAFKTTAPTGKTFTLKFSGAGDIGTSIENGSGITLNLFIGGDGDRTMNGTISGGGSFGTLTIAGTGEKTLKGTTLSFNTFDANKGTLVLDGGSLTVTGSFDMRGGENKEGKVKLINGATLTSDVSMWGRGEGISTISVDETSSFKQNGFTIAGAVEGTLGVISLSNGQYNVEAAESIQDAAINYAGTAAATVTADLTGSTLATEAGAGKLTLSTAKVKSMDLKSNVEVASNLTADSTTLSNATITIAAGKTFTSSNEAVTNLAEGSAATISTEGTGKTVSVSTEGLTYDNALIDVTASSTISTINATLSGSKLVNNKASEVSVSAASLSGNNNSIDAAAGDVTISGSDVNVTVAGLDVAAGKTVKVGDVGNGTANVTTATLANNSTVGGNVTIAASGSLVLTGTGFETADLGAVVDGTLTANATAISMADSAKIDVTGITTSKTFVLATAQTMAITGDFVAANFYTGTLADNVTATVSVLGYGTFGAIDTTSASSLVLTLTATPVTPTTDLTIDNIAWNNATSALVVTVADLSGATGNLDVTVSKEQWDQMVAAVTGAGESISEAVAFTLTDGDNTIDWSSYTGTVAFNGYVGESTGEYAVIYIPEPTTGTLSVLALAALALRRRRK